LAGALGLSETDLATDRLLRKLFPQALLILLVPIQNRAAIARANPDAVRLTRILHDAGVQRDPSQPYDSQANKL
jgi:predicted PhzF superfamily epimerase YddE/YHI9